MCGGGAVQLVSLPPLNFSAHHVPAYPPSRLGGTWRGLSSLAEWLARSQIYNRDAGGVTFNLPEWGGEGSGVAYIAGPKARSWQHVLWLMMTVAGVLLLVFAALSL